MPYPSFPAVRVFQENKQPLCEEMTKYYDQVPVCLKDNYVVVFHLLVYPKNENLKYCNCKYVLNVYKLLKTIIKSVLGIYE